MESDENEEETQASFCRFLDDNFKLPISAYAPGSVPKVEIKERLFINSKRILMPYFNGSHIDASRGENHRQGTKDDARNR